MRCLTLCLGPVVNAMIQPRLMKLFILLFMRVLVEFLTDASTYSQRWLIETDPGGLSHRGVDTLHRIQAEQDSRLCMDCRRIIVIRKQLAGFNPTLHQSSVHYHSLA